MSTANFHTQKKFPLFVISDELFEYSIEDDDENETGDVVYDEGFRADWCNYMKTRLAKLNQELTFHEVILKSGYYSGIQLYVNESYETPYNMTNDECRYTWDMNRSTTIRKYDIEVRKVTKALRKLAQANSMQELNCVGIFSNGEAVYEFVKEDKK